MDDYIVDISQLEGDGISVIDAFRLAMQISKSEVRRTLDQGRLFVNGIKITDISHCITQEDFQSDSTELRCGNISRNMSVK